MKPGPFTLIECPDEQTWLAARRRYLTASDVPAILGQNPWDSPLAVYSRKLGLMPEKEETTAMRLGRLLQPIVRDEYCRETGRQVAGLGDYTLLVSERIPFLACTLDYVVLPDEGHPAEGALEVKTTGAFNHGEWDQEPPVRAQIQLQVQLLVTGLVWGSVAGLIGGQAFRWGDVEEDREFQAAAVEALQEFNRRLDLRDPPPADWTESSKAALKALYPTETGTAVALVPEARGWHEKWDSAKEAERLAKKAKDEYGNLIRQAIGEHTFGVIAGVGRFSLKTVTQPEKVIKGFSYRDLRFAKEK